jgi:hypothetical protein
MIFVPLLCLFFVFLGSGLDFPDILLNELFDLSRLCRGDLQGFFCRLERFVVVLQFQIDLAKDIPGLRCGQSLGRRSRPQPDDRRNDLAFVRGTVSMSMASEGASEPIQFTGKFLEILRKQKDGSWLIAREIRASD